MAVSLSISIMHHTSRAALLEPILRVVPQARVFSNDVLPRGNENHRANFEQMLREIPRDTQYHLMLQDDLVFCRDFLRSVEAVIRARPKHAISLYGARKEIEVAKQRGVPWCRFAYDLWGQAILLPTQWWHEFAEFNEKAFTKVGRFHDDIRMAMFLSICRREVWCTVPTLVNHVGNLTSLLKHNFPKQVSRYFIGQNISGTTVDWNRTANIPVGYMSLRTQLKSYNIELSPEFWSNYAKS